MGIEYLEKPLVAKNIVDRLNAANLGIEVRAEKLQSLISHRDIGKVVSRTQHDAAGAVTTTQHGPSWAQVLRAIDVINRLDGSYQASSKAVDLAAEEYRQLCRRVFKDQAKGGGRMSAAGKASTVAQQADDTQSTDLATQDAQEEPEGNGPKGSTRGQRAGGTGAGGQRTQGAQEESLLPDAASENPPGGICP
jgi:hypothetical protein